MYIKEMTLQNFRCFETGKIKFNDRFNLIVGNNGSGKTAIIEAVSIGMSSFLTGITNLESKHRRNIRDYDVRIQANEVGELTEFEKIYPVKLEFDFDFMDQLISHERILISGKGRTKFGSNDDRIKEITTEINDIFNKGLKEILPAFAYHGTGRLWASGSRWKKDSGFGNRVFGYQYCLEPKSNEKQYLRWIKEMRRYEIDEGVKSIELGAVFKAAEIFMGEGTKISYRLKTDELTVVLSDQRAMPFDKLSDGYKNALGVVFDTAFRMVKLNPWLKEKAVTETPGIILIDEIDLYLHPSWQKRIVSDFKRTFPKMQIIATTHAPIVISSCEENELIILEEDADEIIVKQPDRAPKGWLTEDILEEVMQVNSSREPETEHQIERFKDLNYKKVSKKINDKELKEFEQIKKILQQKLPNDDPIITLIGLEALDKYLKDQYA